MTTRSVLRIPAVLLLAVTTVAPALATVQYNARTRVLDQRGSQAMDMYVEAWVDGEKAKVVFLESGNPWMKAGHYLSTLDGGRTLYLVDPEKETYSVWDLDAILKFAGGMMQSLGPVLQFEIADPDVQLLLEEDGGQMLGLSTRHYRYKTSYNMQIKILGMKREQQFESVHDIWATRELSDVALGVWLRKDPPETGHPEIDKLTDSAWARTEGVPLKMVEETTTTTKKGKGETSRTEFVVESLDTSAGDPAGGYGFPDHYRQVDMMPSLEELSGQQEGEDQKKKGPFGGLFDGGR